MTLLEAYIANIARLDVLADQGLNDSSEADAIRDDMDGQWAEMTEAERVEARDTKCMHPLSTCMHLGSPSQI